MISYIAEGTDIPEELLLPRYQLQELCSEAAKLKNLGAMEAIPADRLVRLLNILEKNIRAAEKMSLVSDPVSTFFRIALPSLYACMIL